MFPPGIEGNKPAHIRMIDFQVFTKDILDVIIITDTSGNIIYVNPAFQRVSGIDPAAILNTNILNMARFHPDDYERVTATVREGLRDAKAQCLEYRYLNGKGHYIWLESTGNPIFDEFGVFKAAIIISRDITYRKCIESALAESEAKLIQKVHSLNTLIDNMNEIVFTYDTEGRLTLANRKCLNLFGYTWEEAAGKELVEFAAESDKVRISEKMKTRLKTGATERYEFTIVTKNGSERLFSGNVSALIENGVISGGIVVAEDITENRLVKLELQEQLSFMQKLMDSIPNPVYLKNRQGLYQGFNKAFEAACGLTRDKILGHSIDEVFPFSNNEYIREMDEVLFSKGGIQEYETCMTYADGSKHDVIINRASYTKNDGSLEGVVGVILDITDRKQLEKQVMALERLNIMAEMAAGIAHEIRNPMTTARGFLQMMGDKPDLQKYRDYFDLVIDELDRANGIITEFLSMGRNKTVNLKLQNLNDIIRTLYPLVLADALTADKNIIIKLDDIPDIMLDQMDIRQLILNLIRNGLEAMAPGGVINVLTYVENDEVVLSVQDQGQGIDPDILDKLGTPFLTTKEQGTGLGLAVCYSIASRHNATIELDTGNTGTNFMVRFKQGPLK